MKMSVLSAAVGLPDRDLLARLPVLAAHERTATAELVAHLAALRLRPSLYAAQGYGSLFAYCRRALRFSEDAASNRIHAARACLKFPVILDLLASGELSLSAVRMLRPHLTVENHERVLGRARNARKADIERLVAELAPRPDLPSSVRRLPLPRRSGPQPLVGGSPSQGSIDAPPSQSQLAAVVVGPSRPTPGPTGLDVERRCPSDVDQGQRPDEIYPSRNGPMEVDPARQCPTEVPAPRPETPCGPRPVVQPLSPGRYRVQFTMGQDAHDTLRRLQTLLRREIPDGDAGAIFEEALRRLHEEVEAAKFGRTPKGKYKPPKRQERESVPACENRIRPWADPSGTSLGTAVTGAQPSDSSSATASVTRVMDAPPVKTEPGETSLAAATAAAHRAAAPGARSRYVPIAVKRAVWYRDRGQCAFVAMSGQRCMEQEYLELHHIQPYALKGPATVANIALRCRLHNAYEAEVVFGPRAMLRHGDSERHEPPG